MKILCAVLQYVVTVSSLLPEDPSPFRHFKLSGLKEAFRCHFLLWHGIINQFLHRIVLKVASPKFMSELKSNIQSKSAL